MRLLSLLFVCFVVSPSGMDGTQRISVGDHSLVLNCSGSVKGPTVVLLAGAGQNTTTWEKVQPIVATFATVCSYDRMGDGASDHPPRLQVEAEIVDDLHKLLTNAKIPLPYVLVGHSIGGMYARSFAETYPKEVAGFVFVDSADEEQVWRYAKIAPSLLFEYPAWPNYAKLSSQGWLLPGRLLEWRSNVPLIVIEHGITWPRGMFKGMTEAQYQDVKEIWHSMQVDLSKRSRYGELRTAEQSGHFIQTRQPEMVIDAIHDVLQKCEKPNPGR